jgi:hypothetical protein
MNERLAEQTREWFDAAQRESNERTRIATGSSSCGLCNVRPGCAEPHN